MSKKQNTSMDLCNAAEQVAILVGSMDFARAEVVIVLQIALENARYQTFRGILKEGGELVE